MGWRLGFLGIVAMGAAACTAETQAACGDGICSQEESANSCAADCDFDLVVVVEAELYEPLEAHLIAYLDGLVAEGSRGYLARFDPAPVSELRAFLAEQLIRHDIEGAFLVGDLPTAWYEQEAFGTLEEFPMDLYLADLDAVFLDTDGNEVLDSHTPLRLDIYTSRVMGEVLALQKYFDRVNRFRREGRLIEPSAFIFVDDDWSAAASLYGLEHLYIRVSLISDPSDSTLVRYLQGLTGEGSEFVFQMMHSGVSYLRFEGQGGGTLHGQHIRDYNLQCSFVHLWNCWAARFVNDANLAMIYTVQNDKGLAAIGSTKKGAVRRAEVLHRRLVLNEPIGEAFRYWYNTYGYRDDEWALGTVVLGDPMLVVWGDVTGMLERMSSEAFDPESLVWMEEILREQPPPPDLDTFADYKLEHPEFFGD